jgi:hypothetical protein
MMHLRVVDAHEDHAVLGQQRTRRDEPRVHHRQPLRMLSPVAARIGRWARVTIGCRSRSTGVRLQRLAEVVVVDEVVAGVVRRVDVDQLDATGVRLVQQLERLEIVPLDEEMAGGRCVDAFPRGRNESSARCSRGGA